MRKLYWEIFLSFWLSSSIVIVSTIWITGVVTRQASIPPREKLLINNYAHSAIAAYQSGKTKALQKWQEAIVKQKKLQFYLISPNQIINTQKTLPPLVKKLQNEYIAGTLSDGLIRKTNYFISAEILTQTGDSFRLVSIGQLPISTQIKIPWHGIINEMLFAILVSGIICYFLSHYLTKPIMNLSIAARKIACGELKTRLDPKLLKRKDEIGDLSQEFNNMAQRIDKLVSAKERLLQDISHELRSPLARLQIAIALCQANDTSNSLTQDLSRMETEIDKLDSLIGEILSLAKLQDPNKKLNFVKTDLNQLLSAIVKDAKFEFSKKNIEIKLTMSSHCYAVVDKNLIHSALENILRNALRYTEVNSTVNINLIKQPQQIIYEVSDQGKGVPEQDLTAIFNAFYRVDSARPSTTGGYGIGLAITRKAIKLHQGSIEAHNLSPHGLKVKCAFPTSQLLN